MKSSFKITFVVALMLTGSYASAGSFQTPAAGKEKKVSVKSKKPAAEKLTIDPCGKEGTDSALPANFELRVVSYNRETMTFKVEGFNLPDEGSFDVSLESLVHGIGALSKRSNDLKANPDDIEGEVFKTTKPLLKSFFPNELEARKACPHEANK